ncbi:unnamed protein product [Cochlearia groenlandica]
MCSNIRSGKLSEWIKDNDCRSSVSLILGGPNPELADLIEQECSQVSWKGIITRIWPRTKYISSVVTGQMAHYIPMLDYYSNNVPLISPSYVSSETVFGINVNPLCKTQDVSYTFMPNVTYFEFLLVDEENKVEIFDLVDVKLGCYYEPLVINYSGLHRYRMGDILQVTGFYNKTPQFKFSSHALLIPPSDHIGGHYVFYFEVKPKTNKTDLELDNELLVECCDVMEKSLDESYRKYRSEDGLIGALEIKVVQRGTFDSVMDIYISRGSSIAQYKTPICLKSPEALEVLENGVLVRAFSKE